jgi:hypothetical protein
VNKLLIRVLSLCFERSDPVSYHHRNATIKMASANGKIYSAYSASTGGSNVNIQIVNMQFVTTGKRRKTRQGTNYEKENTGRGPRKRTPRMSTGGTAPERQLAIVGNKRADSDSGVREKILVRILEGWD